MSLMAFVVLVPAVLADSIAVGDQVYVNWAVNHSATGGEFIISPVVAGTFDTFNTFCVETSEHVSPGSQYVVGNIGMETINGGKPLTAGAAYLFYHFTMGDLLGYDSSTDQTDLQNAIWYFMGLIANPGNEFVTLAVNSAIAGNFYGVRVLTLVTPAGGPAQDMLVYVPDGGLTALLLGIGVGGLAIVSRKFRQ